MRNLFEERRPEIVIIMVLLLGALIVICMYGVFGGPSENPIAAVNPSQPVETTAATEIMEQGEAVRVEPDKSGVMHIRIPARFGTIPGDYLGNMVLCDAIMSGLCHDDGSVTYRLSAEQCENYRGKAAEMIQVYMDQMLAWDNGNQIEKIVTNEDYTKFYVILKSDALTGEYLMLQSGFFQYATLYNILQGWPAESVVISMSYVLADGTEILTQTSR